MNTPIAMRRGEHSYCHKPRWTHLLPHSELDLPTAISRGGHIHCKKMRWTHLLPHSELDLPTAVSRGGHSYCHDLRGDTTHLLPCIGHTCTVWGEQIPQFIGRGTNGLSFFFSLFNYEHVSSVDLASMTVIPHIKNVTTW